MCQVCNVGLVGVVAGCWDRDMGRVDEVELDDDDDEMIEGVL